MAQSQSNAKNIGPEELVDAILQKQEQSQQDQINRSNFRAALAGEIMATLAASTYTGTQGWHAVVKWDVVANDAIEAADALIKKLEEK